ncbi:hypothetical protein JTE90_005915 [Oedothorax gibbosus]|uniref:Uncharacterized protein n=1 Tax=Oedothorax gibbosus TaxID=931172 RepID=A0AAV6UAF8_9ARAC|nr:hypothetical protein JTE90_005915 [Oedothorax gibbosus]
MCTVTAEIKGAHGDIPQGGHSQQTDLLFKWFQFNVANSLSNSIFGIQKPISVRDQFSVLLTLLFSKKEAGHTASARSFVILLSPFPERDSQDSSDKLFTAH